MGNEQELNAMQRCVASSEDDFNQFKQDMMKFQLERMLKKDLISEDDCADLLDDLRQNKDEKELKLLVTCASEEDSKELKSDMMKFQLERMLKKGLISEDVYAAHLRHDMSKFKLECMLEKGSITNDDFQTLQEDLLRSTALGA